MRRAFVTVGLGFGDEGKGATVDALCRQFNADLVVRYSGGHQCCHNVVLPDGTRHGFSQWGAGTYAGAKTYLGPDVIVNPLRMGSEAKHLYDTGIKDPFSLLTLHPDCLITTPFHESLNREKETARGQDRHGSCGLGIGETRSYEIDFPDAALRVRDLQHPRMLLEKLWALYNHTKGINSEPDLVQNVFDGLRAIRPLLQIQYNLPRHQTAVFEGAQGVLLDQTHGFNPHTTWSDVTQTKADKILAWENGSKDAYTEVTRLGITRAYHTRHGAGPFPTDGMWSGTRLESDPGNPDNPWQGKLRFGCLDLPLLRYALSVCGPIDGLVVNCLDELPFQVRVCLAYGADKGEPVRGMSQGELLRSVTRVDTVSHVFVKDVRARLLEVIREHTGRDVLMTADGPTHEHRSKLIVPKLTPLPVAAP